MGIEGMDVRRKYNTPIKIALVYLIISLILYVLGPLAWVTSHPFIFWILQGLYLIALLIGWHVGIQKPVYGNIDYIYDSFNRLKKRLPFLFFINVLYEIINLFRKFGFSSFNFSGLISKILSGVNDLGGSYNSFQESIGITNGAQVVGGNLFTLINLLWEFVSFNLILLGVYFYRELKKSGKILAIVAFSLNALSYISIGTNIGVFRLALAVVIFLLLKVKKGEITIDHEKWRKRRKYIVIVGILGVVLVSVYFMNTMKGRGGILLWSTTYYNVGGIGIDKDSVIFKILPKSLYMFLIAGTAYLTQGYYGMSLCMNEAWEPTFGLGHSTFVIDMLDKYVTSAIKDNTYQYRVAQHTPWQYDVQWHSMYSWVANDISFLGVVIVMFFVGYLFARSYKDAINTSNPFSSLMFFYIALQIFFIPCNNQLFQSSYVLLAFITNTICWATTTGRTKVRLTIRGASI